MRIVKINYIFLRKSNTQMRIKIVLTTCFLFNSTFDFVKLRKQYYCPCLE